MSNAKGKGCGAMPPHLLACDAARAGTGAHNALLSAEETTFRCPLISSSHDIHTEEIRYRLASFPVPQDIVPDHTLEHVSVTPDATAPFCDHEVESGTIKLSFHSRPPTTPSLGKGLSTLKLNRRIYDMENVERKQGEFDVTCFSIPGKLVRSEGEPPLLDKRANEAYDNCAKVLEFYHQVFDYTFLGDPNLPIVSSIHYRKDFQNAQWIGGYSKQMIYGDGGSDLSNFTACLDIIGHEMTHAVTEHLCPLTYQNESGALNEHISDVFGKLINLWDEFTPTSQSDWLIGEHCLMPDIPGIALRNMKSPGTAYAGIKYGTDRQVASVAAMNAYKAKNKWWDMYDHGCVHMFAGVPNRAFVLVSEGVGGYAWEKAGRIWWNVVSERRIKSDCTFVEFAGATADVAREVFGEDVAKIVRDAWIEVGVSEATP